MSAASASGIRGLDRGQIRLGLALLATLTIGIAPIYPEAHLLAKARWLAEGGVGMSPADLVDLALHAAPIAWLGAEAVLAGWRALRPPPS